MLDASNDGYINYTLYAIISNIFEYVRGLASISIIYKLAYFI